MSRPSVFFDNVDELRNEFDWMYEFMGRMAESIRGDPDVHSLHDYVAKIEDENAKLLNENAKLRELVQELWGRDAGLYCSIDGICRDPLCKRNGECSLDNRMRELGIEVDE